MRKSIIILAILLSAISCTKEEFCARQPDFFSARLSSDRTKTVFDSKTLGVSWSNGESISVFKYISSSSNSGNFKFTMTSSGVKQDGSADFAGKIEDLGKEMEVAGKYYAVCPYDSQARLQKDGELVVNIPSSCTGVPDGFPTSGNTAANPMVASSAGKTLSFQNVAGLVKFKIDYDNVSRITLSGNNDENISGTYVVGFNKSGKAGISSEKEVRKTIEMTAPNGQTFVPGAYYFVVRPQIFKKGVCIEMETTDGRTKTFYESKSFTVNAADVVQIGTLYDNVIQFPVTWTTKPGDNTYGTHPEWQDEGRWYSNQPEMAWMDFQPKKSRSDAYSFVKTYPCSEAEGYSSIGFGTSSVVRNIYLYDSDSFIFSLSLKNFSGKLKFSLPMVNTNGPAYWSLSYSLGGDYQVIGEKTFTFGDGIVTNATWECPFWDTGLNADNVLEKEIPHNFKNFSGLLSIKLSAAPVVSPSGNAGNVVITARAGTAATSCVRTAISKMTCKRFFFADARNYTATSSFDSNTSITVSIAE